MSSQESNQSAAPLRTSRTLEQTISNFPHKRISIDRSTLVVQEGPHKGVEVPLERDLFYIGRADWCDLALPKDKHISTVHCELRINEDGIRILDRGSRNGCYVGGYRVFDALLPLEVPFRFGSTHCILHKRQSKAEIDIPYADESGQLVGQDPRMREVFAMLPRLGPKDFPVILTGETGTGKTSIAQALHTQSQRTGPCVLVNCGALSTHLIEAELFGYEKGAFTGATAQHQGYFEQADKGTLFLDEIGELPLDLQPKLLDVLERKCVRRLGGTQEIKVDFRLITATHRDLKAHIKEGLFRQDLYYRLAVFELHSPPLRDRKADLPLLTNHLVQLLEPSRRIQVAASAIHTLQEHYWPGNLRELRNVLERSLFLLDGTNLRDEDLLMPLEYQPSQRPAPSTHTPATTPPDAPSQRNQSGNDNIPTMKSQLATAEREIIAQALDTLDWNVSKAAQILEVSRSWLHARIKSYDLQRPSS